MTFSEVYTEITKRAGEGYGNYQERAQKVFWKAVGTMIREGAYSPDELRLAASRSEAEASLLEEFPYDVSDADAMSSHYVFSIEVNLRPGAPESVHYTRLDERVLHRGAYLAPLAAAGVREVYYSLKYPQIVVMFNREDSVLASAWAYVSVTWIGVPRTIVEGSTQSSTAAYNYFTQQFIDRAIEAAVQLIAQEI